ncbi:MAG: hypothetical protein RIF32_08495 [Leptospirales bacterium]|jgi:hypothetical protein
MVIRYDACENKFPQWAADAAMSRYVGRQRKFVANSPERKHQNRAARTWSYACIAALNKLRYRHQNVFCESREPDPWDFVISRQRRKLTRKIDLAAAWADAEYRILERFHGRMVAVWRPRDSRWDRVVARQRQKIRDYRKTRLRRGGTRKADWATTIRNALYFRLRHLYNRRSLETIEEQPSYSDMGNAIKVIPDAYGFTGRHHRILNVQIRQH